MLKLGERLAISNTYFWLEILIIVAVGVVLTMLAGRAVRMMARRAALGPLAIRPVVFCIRWIGVVIVVAAVVHQFGVDLYNVVTAVLTMLAVGFVAVWSVLSHISCTFLLLIFKPFRVFDEIEFPGEDIKGRVVDLTLLYTTLRTEDGAFIQIPNNLFFQKIIKRREGKGDVELDHQLQQARPAE